MPISKTRDELINYVHSTFEKLRAELDAAGPDVGTIPCVDEWSVKDLLAVRAWWTESVIDWVEAGKWGEYPVTPAQGYRWKETPRLNADVVRKCQAESYESIYARLLQSYERVLPVINSLDDEGLLDVGVFEWAGNYPISRWISINTARQYVTARSFIRRALREQHQ